MSLKIPYLTLAQVLLSFLLICCSSNKRQNKEAKIQINFKNISIVPYIENCKNNQTDFCFQNSISEMIIEEANQKKLILKTDTIDIGLKINEDGSLTLTKNKASNNLLRQVTNDVINNLTEIEPGYLESEKRFISTGYRWTIIIENNQLINKLGSGAR